ncbi:DNA protecting protein DprA [Candidatus Gottesmanbacteria bacterium RBG_16_52_11]|uniref:DNA protecting protein DprA n=1 Tax=Candidatus Gottesmanbacteria bacterium RBG_16_52_11 TaxID=1798374 RepID=A0A1F5YNX6_9BACT|nr:MAG: DNA protecting protein DprA [Candidatus Gottesmanbacteria bacterium RBG_16_52_11]
MPYWIAFSVFPGIGPLRFTALTTRFGSARNAWRAKVTDIAGVIGPALTAAFDRFRRGFDGASYADRLKKLQIHPVSRVDPHYPQLLREIPDAPILLYVRGQKYLPALSAERTVAVVGTRRMTPYGRLVTESIVAGLVPYSVTVVSGLAFGIDAVAHRAALTGGLPTVAVLGCGVDIIAPPSNSSLYNDIVSGGGAVISEMPLGHRPAKGLFPSRNRIISGMSRGVVVTEGSDTSGSLITARYAADQGRDVFAVPGPITSSLSRAPAILIKNGARLAESAEDIAEELGFVRRNKPLSQAAPADATQATVINLLAEGPLQIDEIIRSSGLTSREIAATLTLLEFAGLVKDLGGKLYSLV